MFRTLQVLDIAPRREIQLLAACFPVARNLSCGQSHMEAHGPRLLAGGCDELASKSSRLARAQNSKLCTDR
jgi:hypothetical protein